MPASERYVAISSDCHAGADLRDYKPLLAREWHDDFERWAADFSDPWMEVEEMVAPGPINIGVVSAGSSWNWDSDARMNALEEDGIVAEVLFPNTAPPFFPAGVFAASQPETRSDYERRFAGLQAHNRWLAEFCDATPGRRAGIAQVFLNDVDETVEEIRQAHALGLRGVLIPSDQVMTAVPLYLPRYDKVWAVCEELGMVVHRHGNLVGLPASTEYGIAGPAVGLLESKSFFHRRGLTHLILAGVFDRFPRLKFAMTEVGVGWVPAYLAELDAFVKGARQGGGILGIMAGDAARSLKELPSEYFARNVFLGASLLTAAETEQRHSIGVDHIMWGSDLPHSEGSYPYSVKAMQALFAGIPEDEVARMLGGNAARVYGFDLAALQSFADRFGPTRDQIHSPLTDPPRYPDETVTPTLAPENLPSQAV
jgi:predicted TIM-barrel fold metal-dependent hydrolase